MVYDGTDEELLWRLIAMIPGARVERRTSSSGVITHLVRSDHRVDTRAMLASVGLNVSNTNPTAHHPLQSFITHSSTVATTPTHRDENDAILVQLRGSKEMLIHPPALRCRASRQVSLVTQRASKTPSGWSLIPFDSAAFTRRSG